MSDSLQKDRESEEALDPEGKDVQKFLSVYDEYGSLKSLAARIAAACNNGPFEGEWEATLDFQKGKKPIEKIRRAVEDLFSDVTMIGDDARVFDLWNDLRFPPLPLKK